MTMWLRIPWKVMSKTKKLAVSTLLSFALAWFATSLYGQNGIKIKRVLVISFDGMHSIDFGLWIKNNPGSNIAQLASQGTNFTNASSTKPSDSIPSTVGAFTGASAALGGMYYDDAYNRAWFPPSDLTCASPAGTPIDLKQGIDFDGNALDAGGGINPANLPRQFVNGVCTPVFPHNMMRVNTVFEVVKAHGGNRTAYSEKRPSYDFLNGPSGTGVDDLYTPEINFNNTLADLSKTEAFDELRVQSVLNEIDGRSHDGTTSPGVPTLFGMNFQSINAAKKDSIGSGYDASLTVTLGTPNAALINALQYVDGAIGRMVAELNKQGLASSTAIILYAKHGEAPLDPTHRIIDINSAIQSALTAGLTSPLVAGIPASKVAKITEKTAALIWLKDQSLTQAAADILSAPVNEAKLNISYLLYGETLKLLFPDPLVDPAPPDLIVVPNPGTNFEPTLITTLPAVQAEHGGFNEFEVHVPLLVMGTGVPAGKVKAAVTTTQIAPTILALLGMSPGLLQAVQQEGVAVLPGIPFSGNAGGNSGH
jgi:hypothetical protein